MKMKCAATLLLIVAAGLLVPAASFGQATEAKDGLTALMTKIRGDLKAGKHTEPELADDLRQFDVLLAAENGKRTELAANIILAKGMIYSEVFDDPERAKTYILEIKRNYPNTMIAGKLDPLLRMMDEQAESKRALVAASAGVPFPDFNVIDTAGRPQSVSRYKGKVVLVDFWETSCHLCETELPGLLAAYAKFHDQGFEIIGVSLDEDQDTLLKFTKEKNMMWPEYFDGKKWQNKLAAQYGIMAVPANFLIDTQGNVIATNIPGSDLAFAVGKALAR